MAIDLADLPKVPASQGNRSVPRQADIPTYHVDLPGGGQAELLHIYAMEGVVVTRRAHGDTVGAISPLDPGIVWGDLAADRSMEAITCTAGRRRVSFRTEAPSDRPPDWQQQITNNHLIPASDEVRDRLMAIDVGQHVQINGYW